jgi:putative ABC transport system permease protein
MSLWYIAYRSILQRSVASLLTMFSMALGVMMVVAVLTIHGVVDESFRNNTSLSYNMIVGAKGGKLQLTLNSVYYLSQPVENIPYDYYLEFLPAERRAAAYKNSLRAAAVEAQQAALQLAQFHSGSFSAQPGILPLGLAAGEDALNLATVKALDQARDGKFALYTQLAVPLCLGDYYGQFRCVGTTPAFFEDLRHGENNEEQYTFAAGRNFHHWDEQHGFFEAVVGATVARERKIKVGDDIHPSHGDPEGHTHGQGFTVVGILDPTGTPNDRGVFVNMEGFYLMDDHAKPLEKGEEEEDAQAETADSPATQATHRDPLPTEQREITAMLVRTTSPLVTPGLQNTINEGSVAQAVLPIQEIYNLLEFIVGPIKTLLLVLTVLICVVSGVSILVSIYNSMSERRRDIAVMRALGADRKQVSLVILCESIILSVGGGLIGLLLGHTLNWVASSKVEDLTGVKIGFATFAPGWKISELLGRSGGLGFDFAISPEILLIAGLVLLAIGVGLLPAASAYRTDVSKSLAP